jgi:NMD protein affecting ribosome stability and mRNA decay
VCHAIFEKKRWRLEESAYKDLIATKQPKLTICPACSKIRDRYSEGVLTLRWASLPAHRRDVLGLLRKEEARAKEVNPLERIMRIEEDGDEWRVFTTNTKLAQRMGRELERAYHGDTHYHWAHRDKLVRVVWEREEREE